jgi:hypothetical protein
MNGQDQHITVVDIRIPFWRLVAFMIKAALATIPAAIFLTIIAFIITLVIGRLLGGGSLDIGALLQRWSF